VALRSDFDREARRLTEQEADIEVDSIRDSKGLEGIFRTLWDRVRKAAELIEHLKDENRALCSQNAQLEQQVASLKTELKEKQETLREINEQHQEVLSHSNNLYSEEEKEAVKSRIRELIARINSHL
jgi:DNA repair exonuclease SbcCD ATPase subunit